MKKTIQAVKGTREFYPEEIALRNYLYEKVGAASRAFGYQEYDGPFIETIDLYAAKSGEVDQAGHLAGVPKRPRRNEHRSAQREGAELHR